MNMIRLSMVRWIRLVGGMLTLCGNASWVRLAIPLVIASSGVLFAAEEQPALTQAIPLSRSPYNVRWKLGLSPAAANAIGEHDQFSIQLRELVNIETGGIWGWEKLELQTVPAADAGWLERIAEQSTEPVVDLDIQTAISLIDDAWYIHTQVIQRSIETLEKSTPVTLRDRRSLLPSIVEQAFETFRPIAAIRQVQPDETAILEVKGADLVASSHPFSSRLRCRHSTPFVRFRDNKGIIKKLQAIPWTYLTMIEAGDELCSANAPKSQQMEEIEDDPVDSEEASQPTQPVVSEVDPAEFAESHFVKVRIQSGIKAGLGAKQRGRIEWLAIGCRPRLPATRIQIRTFGPASVPLRGTEVLLTAKPWQPAEGEVPATLDRRFTDRRGRLDIAQHEDGQLVWLNVLSDDLLLGRVPLLPGDQSELVLELPDDSPRLSAKGELALLKASLIEAVALRSTMLAQARKAVRENRPDDYATKSAAVRRLTGDTEFKGRLAAVRVNGLSLAKKNKDRASSVRISRLCDEMAGAIDKYFGEEISRTISEELSELDKLLKEEAREAVQ
jgi:hypothetical protein